MALISHDVRESSNLRILIAEDLVPRTRSLQMSGEAYHDAKQLPRHKSE